MVKKILLELKRNPEGGTELMITDLRQQLLSTYTKIEKTGGTKSKPVGYLLSLFGEDVITMLKYFVDFELPQIKKKELEQSAKYES
mmetsp:Transcript_30365/g.29734  ORF Transcript_30365/g.29734 Transcript_30365/m.29734 type:complete len:86 (-) Transcript_30365:2889-3146(-)